MLESKRECMKSHTQEMNQTFPLDLMLPLDLTYSLPLPLSRQAPKPKGQTIGREQTSWALRYDERSETKLHHPWTLNSERSNPLERTQADPLSLEVKVKRSGSAQ